MKRKFVGFLGFEGFKCFRKDDAKKKSSKEICPTPNRASRLLKKEQDVNKTILYREYYYANFVPGQSILTCLTLKTGGYIV